MDSFNGFDGVSSFDNVDDMDSVDWENYFALFKPCEREYDDWAYEYGRSSAMTLGGVADSGCQIEARCLDCRHGALLQPEYLLDTMEPDLCLDEVEDRLYCWQCGSRDAMVRHVDIFGSAG